MTLADREERESKGHLRDDTSYSASTEILEGATVAALPNCYAMGFQSLSKAHYKRDVFVDSALLPEGIQARKAGRKAVHSWFAMLTLSVCR